MRYGSSGKLTATQPNKTGIETIEKLKKFGYDYIELPLSEIMDLPPGAARGDRHPRGGIRNQK